MTYTVSDLVAEFLHAAGVTTAFGIVSVHNVPMLDAIGRRNAIRFIPTRGEMGGGHMADAYARASGHLGVLITSGEELGLAGAALSGQSKAAQTRARSSAANGSWSG